MKTKFLKMAIKSILVVAVAGFALTALTGCGISYGLYQPGYDGQNYHNNADYYRGVYGYSDNPSASREYNQYNAGNRGYGSIIG